MVRVSDKVMIPQEEYPDINFVGLLIGPRGNTLKTLEKEVTRKYKLTVSRRFITQFEVATFSSLETITQKFSFI